MITLQQAREVAHGDQLRQSDIDDLNRLHLPSDAKRLQLAALWAYDYYRESYIDALAHNDFCARAYGSDA